MVAPIFKRKAGYLIDARSASTSTRLELLQTSFRTNRAAGRGSVITIPFAALVTGQRSSERQHLTGKVIEIAVRNRDGTWGEELGGLMHFGCVHLPKVLPGARTAWMGTLAKSLSTPCEAACSQS